MFFIFLHDTAYPLIFFFRFLHQSFKRAYTHISMDGEFPNSRQQELYEDDYEEDWLERALQQDEHNQLKSPLK